MDLSSALAVSNAFDIVSSFRSALLFEPSLMIIMKLFCRQDHCNIEARSFFVEIWVNKKIFYIFVIFFRILSHWGAFIYKIKYRTACFAFRYFCSLFIAFADEVLRVPFEFVDLLGGESFGYVVRGWISGARLGGGGVVVSDEVID